MENTQPKKHSYRASRSRPFVQPLDKQQARRLESLYEDSPAVNTIDWSTIHNDADDDVINVHNFNTRSTDFQKQQEKNKNDRIIINVCGQRYETWRTTLELYPDTLLGNEKRRKYYYDKTRKEYFFDRHRGCFEAILYYYQSHGRLRRPEYIPLDIFIEEVTFFQLGEQALNQIRKDENIKEIKKVLLPKHPIRRYLWITMEYPHYSKIAKIVNIVSLAIIIISTITLSIETLPQYADLDDLNCEKDHNITLTTTSYVNNGENQNSTQPSYVCPSYFASPFFIIQAICIGFFTIEFLVRILSTPSLLNFIKSLMNWIDLMAIIPFFITLAIRLVSRHSGMNSRIYVNLRFLTILRVARIFKFYRVFKSMKSFRVLSTAITESLLDFLIMTIILSVFGFLFGTVAYYVENHANSQAFDSIFKAAYWGTITITSVGYGDITPITPIGRIISCLCGLVGAATIGMLVSVLVDRYQRIYARTLFINEEQIDIDDYSDDENNDADSENVNLYSIRRRNTKSADNNAREEENVINGESNTVEFLPIPDSSLDAENSMNSEA
ncbi:unnamed protein product [Rotaria sordida]|uniref:BTB domain-containing protein n=3 Tax=Rotaria sordida TaxID=392033 RepID=A0A814M6Q4_9BILA|nr:unnamed protein product [Rotaria sordida]CAF1261662.1 unnamed protein product [Rotaria sordida]